MSGPAQFPPDRWRPPSDCLQLQDGIWQVGSVSAVSYPAAGNEACFQIEDGSYWFRHRLDCLFALLRAFPPGGTFHDIGGGNGYVAHALQSAGLPAALLEPGDGVRNARRRGVHHVIHATLGDACFHPHSLPAAGAFDVLEHIADDGAFLRELHARLVPGGRFYCTVPAGPALWSADDVQAGHFRRYSRRSLAAALERAGFTVEFVSPFFLWLTWPVLLLRALPSRLGIRNRQAIGSETSVRSDHSLPRLLAGPIGRAHAWEVERLRARRPLPFGSSLICVARATPGPQPAA